MKKIKTFAIFALTLLIFALAGCSETYEGEFAYDGRYFLGYSAQKQETFVGMIVGSLDDTSFDLPDEYRGYPVTTLGGKANGEAHPFDFALRLPDSLREFEESQRVFSTTDPSLDERGDGWATVRFNINLGKNVSKIEETMPCAYIGIEITNGEGAQVHDILYRIVPYFTVDMRNSTFYAKDGKLYYKANSEPAGSFEYEF